jgi:hypothetical protein
MSGFSFFDDVGGNGAGGADFLPIVKYDARSGRMARIDREGGESHSHDISRTFKAVFDFENLEGGYIRFAAGMAPDFRVARLADGDPIANPGDGYKKGVRVLVKLAKDCGGDVRELASNARAFVKAAKKLYGEYLEGVKKNAGKLPVVAMNDSYAETSGEGATKSTNYVPVFEITGWVSRPDDLVYQARSSSGSSSESFTAPASPPSTGSTRVSAPSADDFG